MDDLLHGWQCNNHHNVAISIVCRMSDAMDKVSSDGTHTNDNNTSTPSSSLLGAAAVASALPWVWGVYSI